MKTLELNRREVNIANREAALVEELAKRQAMIAIIEKVQESDASTSHVLDQLKTMLAVRASLLKVTKSWLADVVLEIEARTPRVQVALEVKENICKGPRQVLEALAANFRSSSQRMFPY